MRILQVKISNILSKMISEKTRPPTPPPASIKAKPAGKEFLKNHFRTCSKKSNELSTEGKEESGRPIHLRYLPWQEKDYALCTRLESYFCQQCKRKTDAIREFHDKRDSEGKFISCIDNVRFVQDIEEGINVCSLFHGPESIPG